MHLQRAEDEMELVEQDTREFNITLKKRKQAIELQLGELRTKTKSRLNRAFAVFLEIRGF